MKRFNIWLALLIWPVLGAGWWWAGTQAINRLQTPGRATTTATAPQLSPAAGPARRVVMIILSGVGATGLNDLANPFAFLTLRRLAAEGAWGISNAVVPSGDLPTWTALLTGAPPPTSGATSDRAAAVPSTALQTASSEWLVIASQSTLDGRGLARGLPQVVRVASSDRVGGRAGAFLRQDHSRRVVVVLDLARRQQYSGSDLLARLDGQLSEISGALDARRDTLIVTSDHGLLPDGDYGGDEAAVTQTPLVLWGAGVTAGPLGTVQQVDLAPTVAVLLGDPIPALGSGRPVFEALRLTPQAQAHAHLMWLDQQVALVEPPQGGARTVEPAVATAQEAYARGDWSASSAAAERAVSQQTTPPVLSTAVSSTYLWSIGLPLLLLLSARLLARWGRRLAYWLALPLLGMELYVLAWSLLFFVIGGHTVSLSSVYRNPPATLISVGAWAALALFGAVLPLAWAAVGSTPRGAIQQVNRLTGLLQVVGAGTTIVIVLVVKEPLKQTGAWSGLLLVVAQLVGIALAAPVAALFAAALTDVFERGR